MDELLELEKESVGGVIEDMVPGSAPIKKTKEEIELDAIEEEAK